MIARLDNASSLLLDRFQHGFPLVPEPFAEVGRVAGVDEAGTLTRYRRMLADGIVSRIGAVVAPNVIGVSTLAAMSIPEEEIVRVAETINCEPGVNHNYEREHAINLWFVVGAANETALGKTLGRIQSSTGYAVRDLRLEEPFHLDLGFSITGEPIRTRLKNPDRTAVLESDHTLLAVIEGGLPLISRPYRQIALSLGWPEERVIARLRILTDANVIRRFGVVVHHRALGMRANAMAVWDIPDEHTGELGRRFAEEPGVTLCYRRRRAADWPNNLYCMVHGAERGATQAVVDKLNAMAHQHARAHAVLFSKRCFKQTGARFGPARSAA